MQVVQQGACRVDKAVVSSHWARAQVMDEDTDPFVGWLLIEAGPHRRG